VKLYHIDVLHEEAEDNSLLLSTNNLDQLLPEVFLTQREVLLTMPLYELAERLHAIFELERLNEQSAYVFTFYDQLASFVSENTADIDSLLAAWDESLRGKTIQSKETNGVRILSIHKSKGLEYDFVICPFCDWQLEKSDILWCQPQEQPFSDLPIAPVDYSQKQMLGTIYEQDYLQEHLQNTVDNLNLLYVAFTRAKRGLYVIGKRGAKNSRSGLIEKCLPLVAKDMPQATLEGLEDEKGKLIFTSTSRVSRISRDSSTSRDSSSNPFLQPAEPIDVDFHYLESQVSFRQSNRSQAFIEADESDEIERQNYIQTGSVLHQIFSTIRTTDDIEDALKQLQFEGVLYDEQITPERITKMLRKRLQDQRVADWFSPHWTLFNECTILTTENGEVKERRPDRVMNDGDKWVVVDFKFGSQKPEYIDQVREYMQLIRAMQPSAKVSGYLWFVYSNKIEEIKD
jgi:ATP-dependent exoDNAse (exonuclease V) beta subunit